jgi:hypothetical protein
VFVPGAWTAVTFANSWVNFDAAHPTQYRKIGEDVEIRGAIKSGTVAQAAFTLPVGYRPSQEQTYAVVSNGALGILTINLTGTVVPATGSNVYFYLPSLRFSTIA